MRSSGRQGFQQANTDKRGEITCKAHGQLSFDDAPEFFNFQFSSPDIPDPFARFACSRIEREYRKDEQTIVGGLAPEMVRLARVRVLIPGVRENRKREASSFHRGIAKATDRMEQNEKQPIRSWERHFQCWNGRIAI